MVPALESTSRSIEHHGLVSTFDFNVNLRRYPWEAFGATVFWVVAVCGGIAALHLNIVWAIRQRGWEVGAVRLCHLK
jgi:hypothetical protein